MIKLKSLLSNFINGYFYPIFIALVVLIGHTFSTEIFSFYVIVISAIIGMFFCKNDLRFLVSPVLMIVFCVSEKSSNLGAGKLFHSSSLIQIFIIASLFAISLIAYLIIKRKTFNTSSLLKSPMFYAFAILAIGIAFNGLFVKEGFSFSNFLYTLAVIGSLFGIFIAFYLTIDFSKDFKKYLVYVLYIASIVVLIEFITLFLNGQVKYSDGKIIKESVITGWGIWNNIGCMLTMLLPVHFYLASFVKRFGFVFYFTGIISYLAIALSLSRSSLLVSSILIVICVIFSCFYGKNKLTNKIITLIFILLGIAFISLYWNKIATILNDYLVRGFSDNGRFKIYITGLFKYFEYPIFGTGFFSYATHQSGWLPFGYHNTIVQMLASCGTIGMLAYIYHRYKTIQICYKKRSAQNFPLYLCLLGLLLTSLLDVHFFNIYPAFYYSIILLAIEKADA